MDENTYTLSAPFEGRLCLEYIQNINYALVHNNLPAVVRLVLTNSGSEPWTDVEISVMGPMLIADDVKIDTVAPGSDIDLTQRVKIMPDPDEMIRRQEASQTAMTVILLIGGQEALVRELPLRLMPYDHWMGIGARPELLSAFVTPNHPEISRVVVAASKFMQWWTGRAEMDEYQSGDANRVRQQVAAVYEALRSEGLVYVTPPASFEQTGQRVRTVEKVLNEKTGTCLDLSLLMASCLEAVGIEPVLVILKGHCMVGAWLAGNPSYGMVNDDVSLLKKSAADGINELVLLESTALTSAQPVEFEQAVDMAMDAIRDETRFECSVNVADCRLNGVLPLPLRVRDGERWVVVNPSEGRDNATREVRRYDRYDLSAYDTDSAAVTKYTIWERKLLDFSLRNNLLNMRMGRRVIPLVSFEIDRLEDHLQDGETFKVLPYPLAEAPQPGADGLPDSQLCPQLQETVVKGLESKKIYSFHTDDALADAMKYAYRAARTSLEENGASNLYLVLGVLKWFETPGSTVPRFAPILLLPIDMKRRLGGQGYDIRTRDEEIVLNITLSEMLKQQHEIDLSALAASLPIDDHGVDVKKIFAVVRDKIRDKRGWNVLDEAMIGLFSFSKFVMWNDIHSNSSRLQQHPVISSLVDGRLNIQQTEAYTDAKEADANIRPGDLATPIDVDSSQLEAIIDAGAGRSFILHGPPGTGKSQTITNIIANALYQGRRVLFVAEKMAALEVVQSRLARIGLAPFCLELHSNKATKQHFLRQMDQALSLPRIQSPEQYAAESERLYTERLRLGRYIDALHTKGPGGLSLYDCIVMYLDCDGDAMPVDAAEFARYTLDDIDSTVQRIEALDTLRRITGNPAENPLRGLCINDGSSEAEARIRSDIKKLHGIVSRLDPTYLPLVRDGALVAALRGAVEAGLHIEATQAQMAQRFGPGILNRDIPGMLAQWQQINAKWALSRMFASRSFLSQYGMTPDGMDYLAQCHEAIQRDNALFMPMVPALQRSLGYMPLAQCMQVLEQCGMAVKIFERMAPLAVVEVPDAELPPALTRWDDAQCDMRNWYLWCREKQSLPLCVIDYMQNTGATGAAAARAFRKGLARALAQRMIDANEELRHFNGMLFDDAVARYRSLTARFQELCKLELRSRLGARMPSMTMEAHDSSEIGFLKRNIKNGGRGVSIRGIIDQIPSLLPRLCPCMLMSPLSVAQYISLDQPKFDLVIFDEASQMPTSEAVGAIARGNALIVVGDPRQMPPTSFFSTQAVGEDEAQIDDMESILDDCISLSVPSKYLTWHYRSRHESLIAFSNVHYYEGRLLTFPSVDDGVRKVTLQMVDGVYDRSRSRSNANEARAIVDEVLRRLSDPELSHQSIGIVSFSKVQQDKIEDMLTDELAKHPELEKLAYEAAEPIFIKNLENVQGDERDVILFSVGYGPDSTGKVSMNFGPLNNAGGERRLNVAVSRARHEMMVFSSLKPEQIDLRRTNALGVAGLKAFLEFARTGRAVLPAEQASAAEPSVVSRQIADALEAAGYDAVVSVGRSRFHVDVAVKDKSDSERFILGILVDTPEYQATKTMRDREVVQPSVLRGLGWNIAKVWTLDWFERRQVVVDTLLSRLKDIEAGHDEEPQTEEASEPVPEPKAVEVRPDRPGAEYKFAAVPDTPNAWGAQGSLRDQVLAVITQEQPITTALLYKRVAKLQGVSRVTLAFRESVDRVLRGLRLYATTNAGHGEVYWTDPATAAAYRGFRNNSGRDITEVPCIEIDNAMRFVIDQQLSLGRDDLKRLTANQLGFSRLGPTIDEMTQLVLDNLALQGYVVIHGDRVSKP